MNITQKSEEFKQDADGFKVTGPVDDLLNKAVDKVETIIKSGKKGCYNDFYEVLLFDKKMEDLNEQEKQVVDKVKGVYEKIGWKVEVCDMTASGNNPAKTHVGNPDLEDIMCVAMDLFRKGKEEEVVKMMMNEGLMYEYDCTVMVLK